MRDKTTRLYRFWCWFKELEKDYYELLWGVEQKHPGESRHQTALRYILERESRVNGPAGAAARGEGK